MTTSLSPYQQMIRFVLIFIFIVIVIVAIGQLWPEKMAGKDIISYGYDG
jgi:hypothetical protein